MGQYSLWIALRSRRNAALKSLARRAIRRLMRLAPWAVPSGLSSWFESGNEIGADWDNKSRFLDAAIAQHTPHVEPYSLPGRTRVLHLIGSLQAGGAERQLCNCAIGQLQLGMDVSVMLLNRADAEHGHYEQMLARAGVNVRVAGETFNPSFEEALRRATGIDTLLQSVPPEFCPWAIDVFGELLTDRPDIFHSWLDHPNIWGGVGAILANIPLVVLSTRNVNPTHFPYLTAPYMRPMYLQFAGSRNVRFINNSHAGAADYARWLGVPKEKFAVVLNGVDFSSFSRSGEQTVSAFFDELHIPPRSPLIAGVFRLSEEKQPLTFLEVVRRVIVRSEHVYAVVAGIGPYEQEMREFIVANKLTGRVFMLGRRTDVSTIFSASALTLLCSRQEGTPNVLLEAQWLGCPVVATKAGGAVDAVRHGETGYLVDVGDVDSLERAVWELLQDSEMRGRLSANGPPFINAAFGVDRMVRETTDVYRT